MNSTPPQGMDWRLRVFDSLSFPTLVLKPDRTIVAANLKLLDNLWSHSKGYRRKELSGIFSNPGWRPRSPLPP